MKKTTYNKISIARFARQMQVNFIADEQGLILSRQPNSVDKGVFDLNMPHIVDGIALVLCKSGHASIKVNFMEHEIKPQSMLVLIPNNIVQVMTRSDDLKIDFLFFTFDFLSGIRLSTQLDDLAMVVQKQCTLHLANMDFEDLLSLHRLLLHQYEKKAAYHNEYIKNIMYTVVYQVLQLYSASGTNETGNKNSRQQDIYQKFVGLLYENYRHNRSVQFYADRLFLSRKYFSRVILELTGKTPQTWITELVIMAIKALLKSTDLTVTQIAEELEFPNASFLVTYFKKSTGMSPLQYRNA